MLTLSLLLLLIMSTFLFAFNITFYFFCGVHFVGHLFIYLDCNAFFDHSCKKAECILYAISPFNYLNTRAIRLYEAYESGKRFIVTDKRHKIAIPQKAKALKAKHLDEAVKFDRDKELQETREWEQDDAPELAVGGETIEAVRRELQAQDAELRVVNARKERELARHDSKHRKERMKPSISNVPYAAYLKALRKKKQFEESERLKKNIHIITNEG